VVFVKPDVFVPLVPLVIERRTVLPTGGPISGDTGWLRRGFGGGSLKGSSDELGPSSLVSRCSRAFSLRWAGVRGLSPLMDESRSSSSSRSWIGWMFPLDLLTLPSSYLGAA